MKTLVAATLLGMTAAPLAAQSGVVAQAGGRNPAVATAMRNTFGRFDAPRCEGIDKGMHFKVSSGKVYLKTGHETPVDDNKMRALENGERVITEAIVQNGQGNSASAWYYLGRTYLQKGDIAGADSAFDRALKLAPQCKDDINAYTRVAWAALVNPGVDAMKAQQSDSAARLFQQANSIFSDAPHAYFYLASLAYEKDDMAQALAYFDSALAKPKDPKNPEVHAQAQFNKGVVLLRLNRGQEALPPLREYAASHPADKAALRALFNAYQASGMPDSAAVVAKQLEAAGDSVVRRPVVQASAFNKAVELFNAEKYAEAAKEGEAAVAAEPNNRDAYYLLTQSYYQTKAGAPLVKAGEKLVQLDPMNERALQMLGFGYGLTNNSKAAVATRLRLNSLPVAISQVTVAPAADGVTLTATATGRNATDAGGKALATAPVTLVFEFVNKDDATVTSQEAVIPALKAGETHQISLAAKGAGIVSWRYKKK